LRATEGSEAISRIRKLTRDCEACPERSEGSAFATSTCLLAMTYTFMQLNIKATNLELTSNIKDYVQKKMDMLDKYLGKLKVISAHFEVSQTTNHHQKGEIFCAEANLIVNGDLLRVEKTEKDVYKAIDKVKTHLEQAIKKYKDKKIDRKKQKQKLGAMA